MHYDEIPNTNRPSWYIEDAFKKTLDYVRGLEDQLTSARQRIEDQANELQDLIRLNFRLSKHLESIDPSIRPFKLVADNENERTDLTDS